MKLALFLGILVALTSADAVSWTGTVSTDSNNWHLTRQSQNLSFDINQSFEGSISPVEGPRGRLLNPFYSYYSDLNINEVRLHERTSALEGSFRSAEQVKARSRVDQAVGREITKLGGTDVITVAWSEQWPVALVLSKGMDYAGSRINERSFAGNNLDFAGANFLYSTKFSKKMALSLGLERFNATVEADDRGIEAIDLMATKHLDYKIQAYSTGIADLSYRQFAYHRPANSGADTAANEGDQRYSGDFIVRQTLRMKSKFSNFEDEPSWLNCCFGELLPSEAGWSSTTSTPDSVFNCFCADEKKN